MAFKKYFYKDKQAALDRWLKSNTVDTNITMSDNNKINIKSRGQWFNPDKYRMNAKPIGLWYAPGKHWLEYLVNEYPAGIADYIFEINLNKSQILMMSQEKVN